jgi:hypothetical protein
LAYPAIKINWCNLVVSIYSSATSIFFDKSFTDSHEEQIASKIVGVTEFESAHLSALESKSSVATNYTTPPLNYYFIKLSKKFLNTKNPLLQLKRVMSCREMKNYLSTSIPLFRREIIIA